MAANKAQNDNRSTNCSERRENFRKAREEISTSIDFDDLLPIVGEFGLYQKLLVFLVCLPACIPCGIHAFSQLFMANEVVHWCQVGEPPLRHLAQRTLQRERELQEARDFFLLNIEKSDSEEESENSSPSDSTGHHKQRHHKKTRRSEQDKHVNINASQISNKEDIFKMESNSNFESIASPTEETANENSTEMSYTIPILSLTSIDDEGEQSKSTKTPKQTKNNLNIVFSSFQNKEKDKTEKNITMKMKSPTKKDNGRPVNNSNKNNLDRTRSVNIMEDIDSNYNHFKSKIIEEFIRDIFIPFDIEEDRFSCCQMYDVNFTSTLMSSDWKNAELKRDWNIKDCDSGWYFDEELSGSSIIIDFSLVCSKSIFPTVGLAVLNLGGIIGVYIFGNLSDKFGRRFSFLVCLAMEQVFALLTAFMPSFELWLLCRFFVGLTIPAIYQIPFIISMELVGPNYRSFVTVMTCLFYVSGMIILSGVAYLVRDWRTLAMVTSLPFFTYVVYWWVLPESPRWLLGRSRLSEASTILHKMASVNGVTLPESFQQRLKHQMLCQQSLSNSKKNDVATDSSVGFKDLWRTPNMRLKTFLILIVWFANETVYVGLSYYGPAMGTDQYLSFFLSCLVEIPSYFFCWLIMDRMGRRWILGVGMIVGGICSVFTVALPHESKTESLIFYLVAKFAESAAFLIIYPFTAELFPTVVRGVGIGFAAYVGGLGLLVIPFINYLGSDMLSLPLLIMGVLSVVGGVAAFRLPETLHMNLPNTISEGESFGTDFTWRNCCSCEAAPQDIECASLRATSSATDEVDRSNTRNDSLAEATPFFNRRERSAFNRRHESYRKACDPQFHLSDGVASNIALQEGRRFVGDASSVAPSSPSVAPKRRGKLVKQESIVPIITDSRGAMKMTFWM